MRNCYMCKKEFRPYKEYNKHLKDGYKINERFCRNCNKRKERSSEEFLAVLIIILFLVSGVSVFLRGLDLVSTVLLVPSLVIVILSLQKFSK